MVKVKHKGTKRYGPPKVCNNDEIIGNCSSRWNWLELDWVVFLGDKRSFHSSVKVWKGSKLKRSTIPSISFFLSPSSCKIYCERMFATYVPHPFRSDRAGVGKGSISTWFGKHFHSFFLVYHLNRKKAGLHDQTRKFKKKKKQFSSEPNLISPGFHSKSLTAILCWGGCLSALSLLSKVKTGPKWGRSQPRTFYTT